MSRTADASGIRALLARAAAQIDSDSAQLDAEVLLAHVLQQPRSYLVAWPEHVPDSAQQAAFSALVERRCAGEPVAHLTGRREFWSLDLDVTPATLIPRPDTESLVQCALAHLPVDAAGRVADLGTGSGCIALALAHERPACQVIASDVSSAALQVARANAARLGVTNIDFIASDWCDALGETSFDLIVSNPPYIAVDDPHLHSGDVRFEPHSALAAGADGLDDLRRIIACARAHLAAGGSLLLEHGYDQGAAVRQLLCAHGYRAVTTHCDLAGHERVSEGLL